ncbi:CCAAT- binding transcription factor component [Malassezia caprae]|uniref:CCAAT- binding transcription factor component n=1 Tax=Malassezia caprae TaxID=1381934 RepID=A0AAF0IV16_9BASI|nr:CCAAT- binding transcription factor component [Malassezia caprae]
MRPAGDGLPMQGAVDMDKVGAAGVDSLGLLPDVPPGERLSTLIQHYSRNPAQFQRQFWRHQMNLVENGCDSDGKPIDFFNLGSAPTGNSSALPLARIKKVMKNDDEVKMISAEAPILFSRACEIFIADLTCRAFMIAEENKRRTIQRSDIANAIARSDLFDFLIDIVPRSDMMRGRSTSVPIRNAMPAVPFPGPDVAPRMGMPDPSSSAFMQMRPSPADVRRMDPVDASLNMGPGAALKGMPKPTLPNEWGSGMYSFPPPSMGDTRMHPGAGLGMPPPPTHASPSRTMMPRNGVETAGFMDANAPLSMPGLPARGNSLLNMVPYTMDDSAKNDTNTAE